MLPGGSVSRGDRQRSEAPAGRILLCCGVTPQNPGRGHAADTEGPEQAGNIGSISRYIPPQGLTGPRSDDRPRVTSPRSWPTAKRGGIGGRGRSSEGYGDLSGRGTLWARHIMLIPNKLYSLLTMYHNATGSARKPQTARHCVTCARSGGRAGAGPSTARAARSGPAMDIRTSRENPQRRPRGSRRHVWSRRTNEGRQAARASAPRSDAPQLVGLKLPRIPATAGALDHIGHSVTFVFFLEK